MKIFRGKSFFFKSILLHTFIIFIISFVSLNFWENPIYDMFVNSQLQSSTSEDIVLLMVDKKSTDTYRWPWERALYSEVFKYFSEYTNSKVILYDFLINAPDINNPKSDKTFFDTLKNTDNVVTGFKALINDYNGDDGLKYDKAFEEKFSVNIIDKRESSHEFSGSYNSLDKFPKGYFDAQKYTGAVNLNVDGVDGGLRISSDLIRYKGKFYPSLPLRGYLLANNTDEVTITDKYLIVDKTGLKIPIYESNGDIGHYIKFYNMDSEYSHKAYSAIDIINSYRLLKQNKKPLIDPSEFNNKIIVFGANLMNSPDVLETPIAHQHSGADVQATILENFLNNESMHPLSFLQNVMIIILLSIITFTVIRLSTFIKSLLILIFIASAYVILCQLCFYNNIAPWVITPLATQLSTMIFGYSYRFILEGKNKEKIKNAMGKYLSQDIMKNVVQNIDDIKLGGKKTNVTVLFSDIRGFTSMSEKMTAEEVSMILNEYFSEMEPIITKYNGVINKFIGDAVMAIFGEPIQDINHPQNAVKCAWEMLKKVEQLSDKWVFEGKPKIEIGIGINTGEAFVGNIGSEKRLEYTVIGDTVNIASRIEGYNKVYKTNLLISTSTYSRVSDIADVIKIADVTIRGKSKKMDIYEVLKLVEKLNG